MGFPDGSVDVHIVDLDEIASSHPVFSKQEISGFSRTTVNLCKLKTLNR